MSTLKVSTIIPDSGTNTNLSLDGKDSGKVLIVDDATIGGDLAVAGNVVVTGTVEPAGDVAAGDNAAVGYQSGDGLVLIGQGGNNDVTIKNDTKTDVLKFPTGQTDAHFGGNLVFATADKGIYLGVTSATAANLLDDYEEGTFTPSVGGNASYNTQVGHYVRIGRSVTIVCEVHINSIGTGSTSTITGIPFAPVSESSLAMAKSTNLSGSFIEVTARISGTTIYYMTRTAASATQGTNTAIHGDGTLVNFCGSYIASS